MAFTTMCMSVVFMLVTLGSSSRDEYPFSVDTLPDIVVSVQQYVRSGCVFILSPGMMEGRDVVKLMRLKRSVNSRGVSTAVIPTRMIDQTFNCNRNRPLLVSFFTNRTIQQTLEEISKTVDLSEAKWLQFMDSEQLEEYLNGTYIPLDCHFIVARPTESGAVIFTEVYHIRRNQRLQKSKLGEWHLERGPSWTNMSFYKRRRDLQGATINAAVISDGAICRITEFRNNKPVQVGGFFGMLWNALQYQLNFTSEFVKPPDGGYGSRGKNGWSGMIGMLVRKEAEVAVGAYVMTQLLLDYVHFVSPMGTTKISVFVRRPGPSFGTTWDTYMAPFCDKLWMAVLCAILVISFGLTVTLSIGYRIGIEKNDKTTHLSLYDSFIYIFGCICQQGHEWTPWSWPCRLVFLTASLAAVVLLAAYSATFISFLTVRHSSLPFTTFEGILQDGTFKLGILERSVELSFFDTATETVMQNVYRKLILPALEDAPPDTLAGLQRVCDQPKYGFVVDSKRAYSVLNNLTCDIVALPEAFIPATGTFVVAKHSPYRRLINFNLEEMRRHGELWRMFVRAMPSKISGTSSTTLMKVRFGEVVPIFAVLSASLVLASVLLATEWCMHRNMHRRGLQHRHLNRLRCFSNSGFNRSRYPNRVPLSLNA